MSPFCREYFYVWTRILESWAKLFTFLREFFYSGGLYKNIGHHSWPTTRNLKKKKQKKKQAKSQCCGKNLIFNEIWIKKVYRWFIHNFSFILLPIGLDVS